MAASIPIAPRSSNEAMPSINQNGYRYSFQCWTIDLLRENFKIALHFIEIISTRLKEVEEMMEHMAYGSVRKRLLFLLHKLSEKFGSGTTQEWIELEVKLTHQELASMMGSIRETVSEQLTQLAAEGIVSKEGLRKPLRVHPERLKMAWEVCR